LIPLRLPIGRNELWSDDWWFIQTPVINEEPADEFLMIPIQSALSTLEWKGMAWMGVFNRSRRSIRRRLDVIKVDQGLFIGVLQEDNGNVGQAERSTIHFPHL
jgi:hypothetical protein